MNEPPNRTEKKNAPPPDTGNGAKNIRTGETAKRAKTGRKTGRGATIRYRRSRFLPCRYRDCTSFEYLPNRTADIWRCGRYRLYPRHRPHRFPRHFNQPRRFSWRNRAGAGIEPASPDIPQRRDTARKIEFLASHGLYFPYFTKN